METCVPFRNPWFHYSILVKSLLQYLYHYILFKNLMQIIYSVFFTIKVLLNVQKCVVNIWLSNTKYMSNTAENWHVDYRQWWYEKIDGLNRIQMACKIQKFLLLFDQTSHMKFLVPKCLRYRSWYCFVMYVMLKLIFYQNGEQIFKYLSVMIVRTNKKD